MTPVTLRQEECFYILLPEGMSVWASEGCTALDKSRHQHAWRPDRGLPCNRSWDVCIILCASKVCVVWQACVLVQDELMWVGGAHISWG